MPRGVCERASRRRREMGPPVHALAKPLLLLISRVKRVVAASPPLPLFLFSTCFSSLFCFSPFPLLPSSCRLHPLVSFTFSLSLPCSVLLLSSLILSFVLLSSRILPFSPLSRFRFHPYGPHLAAAKRQRPLLLGPKGHGMGVRGAGGGVCGRGAVTRP